MKTPAIGCRNRKGAIRQSPQFDGRKIDAGFGCGMEELERTIASCDGYLMTVILETPRVASTIEQEAR
jgi:hypothetical protein